MIKYLNKSNSRFVPAHRSRVQLTTAASKFQELEADGHIPSIIMKQREINACAALSFLPIPRPQRRE